MLAGHAHGCMDLEIRGAIWAADLIIVEGEVTEKSDLSSALQFLTALAFSMLPSCRIFILGKTV